MLTKADIRAEIERLRAELRERCVEDVAGAIEVLREIATDPNARASARIEAVRLLVRRAGHSWADPVTKGSLDVSTEVRRPVRLIWKSVPPRTEEEEEVPASVLN